MLCDHLCLGTLITVFCLASQVLAAGPPLVKLFGLAVLRNGERKVVKFHRRQSARGP